MDTSTPSHSCHENGMAGKYRPERSLRITYTSIKPFNQFHIPTVAAVPSQNKLEFYLLRFRHNARNASPCNGRCKVHILELMIPSEQAANANIDASFRNGSQNAGSAAIWPDFAPLTLFLWSDCIHLVITQLIVVVVVGVRSINIGKSCHSLPPHPTHLTLVRC